MRRAEKPDNLADPDLSEVGRERAKVLVTWIPQVCPLFDISKHSARPSRERGYYNVISAEELDASITALLPIA
jgi:hypothetical protein